MDRPSTSPLPSRIDTITSQLIILSVALTKSITFSNPLATMHFQSSLLTLASTLVLAINGLPQFEPPSTSQPSDQCPTLETVIVGGAHPKGIADVYVNTSSKIVFAGLTLFRDPGSYTYVPITIGTTRYPQNKIFNFLGEVQTALFAYVVHNNEPLPNQNWSYPVPGMAAGDFNFDIVGEGDRNLEWANAKLAVTHMEDYYARTSGSVLLIEEIIQDGFYLEGLAILSSNGADPLQTLYAETDSCNLVDTSK